MRKVKLPKEALRYIANICDRGIGSSLMVENKQWLSDRDIADRILKVCGYTDADIKELCLKYSPGHRFTPLLTEY